MPGKMQKNRDGTYTIEMTLTESQIRDVTAQMEDIEANHPALLGGGNDYCITCTKPGDTFGKKTTVHVGNKIFAFAKGVAICGTGFSITDGKCH